jgi:TAG lipase / steryl ester hydrolase / phospholipase A2 / LPA acyltransferase
MQLEYLQRAAFFHDGPQGYNEKSQQCDGSVKRQLSKSSGQKSLLSPVARLLRDSAEVVSSAVLQVRDGLTDEQRAARRKLEERKQILSLRLKNVGACLCTAASKILMRCADRHNRLKTGKLQRKN